MLFLGLREGPLTSTLSWGTRVWWTGMGVAAAAFCLLNPKVNLPFVNFVFHSSLQERVASLNQGLSELGGSFGIRGRDEGMSHTGSWEAEILLEPGVWLPNQSSPVSLPALLLVAVSRFGV